jgi:predicted MFS family arabinose efflux permease
MLLPLLGGIIVELTSYRAVFAVTAVSFALALILTLGLHAKRG